MALLSGDINLAVFAVKCLFFKRNLLLEDQTPLASRGPQERGRVPRQNPMHSLGSDVRAPFHWSWQQPLQGAKACCVNRCHCHHFRAATMCEQVIRVPSFSAAGVPGTVQALVKRQ